jgi:hypothetical protein
MLLRWPTFSPSRYTLFTVHYALCTILYTLYYATLYYVGTCLFIQHRLKTLAIGRYLATDSPHVANDTALYPDIEWRYQEMDRKK